MTGATTERARVDAVDAYRDDGPLARALGRNFGGALPLRAPALLALALAPLPVVAAVAGADAPVGAAAAVLAWAIVLGGASSGRPATGLMRWTEPPFLRAIEYGGLIWIAALDGPSAYPAAFALLAALAFRHYDLVYRLRNLGRPPARWVSRLAGGWELRLLAAFALLAAGALPAGYYAAAVVLGAVFVAESAADWRRGGAGDTLGFDDDDDEEDELG